MGSPKLSPMAELTRILNQARNGDAQAAEDLAAVLYEQLREMARREMAHERPEHTLQPTALVHEAYLRLCDGEGSNFENRAHFMGAAAAAIRRVLVDHARRRLRLKRGGGWVQLELDDLDPMMPVEDHTLISLDDALCKLNGFAPDAARVVELRFFAGDDGA